MTCEEIYNLVNEVTGVTRQQWNVHRPVREILYAKYVAVLMMHEHGYRPAQIVVSVLGERTQVYNIVPKALDLLDYNREFVKVYVACCIRRVELEEAKEGQQVCA